MVYIGFRKCAHVNIASVWHTFFLQECCRQDPGADDSEWPNIARRASRWKRFRKPGYFWIIWVFRRQLLKKKKKSENKQTNNPKKTQPGSHCPRYHHMFLLNPRLGSSCCGRLEKKTCYRPYNSREGKHRWRGRIRSSFIPICFVTFGENSRKTTVYCCRLFARLLRQEGRTDGRKEGMLVDKCHSTRQEKVLLVLFFFLNTTSAKPQMRQQKKRKGLSSGTKHLRKSSYVFFLFLFINHIHFQKNPPKKEKL